MSELLNTTELVDITEHFIKVGRALKNDEYVLIAKDYLIKVGTESLNLEEQFTLIKEYKKALSDLKSKSAIGSDNRKIYIREMETINRYEKRLREVELNKIYEPLAELGIERNPKKQKGFSVTVLQKKQKKIDDKHQ